MKIINTTHCKKKGQHASGSIAQRRRTAKRENAKESYRSTKWPWWDAETFCSSNCTLVVYWEASYLRGKKKKEWEEGGRKKKKRSWGAKYEAFKLWEEAYRMTGAKEPSNHQPVPDRNGADVDHEQGKRACNRVPFEFKNQLRERATWSLV